MCVVYCCLLFVVVVRGWCVLFAVCGLLFVGWCCFLCVVCRLRVVVVVCWCVLFVGWVGLGFYGALCFAVRCLLLVVCCVLFVVCCVLLVVWCSLFVVCWCSVYGVRCVLFVVCCMMFVVRCLFVVCARRAVRCVCVC